MSEFAQSPSTSTSEAITTLPAVMPQRRRYYWTTREEKILREHYPNGGLRACMPLLPNRSPISIYARANILGLKSAKRSDHPLNAWPPSPEIDEQIRRVYQSDRIGRGEVNELATRLQRPRWWVSGRARQLGLVAPRFKQPDWTGAEEDVLEANAHKSDAVLQRLLRNRGFHRSEAAIHNKVKRLRLDRHDPNHFTATGLAVCLGLDGSTVANWCEKGWIKATKRGTERTPQQGGDQWWIHRRNVRSFIVENAARIDLRKVDKFWFIEFLVDDA